MDGMLERRFTRDAIAERVTQMARELAAATRSQPVVLVAVLPGGVPLAADLARALPVPVEVDFLAVRPLDPGGAGRQPPALNKDLELDVAGRCVVLVDDAVESGRTLAFLLDTIRARRPAHLLTCVLVDRPQARVVDVPVDLCGFEVGEEPLLGYGMAVHGRYRNAPDVWAVADAHALRSADPVDVAGVLGGAGAQGPR